MTVVEINMIIDRLISIKDSHRDELTYSEIDTINDACNILEENTDILASDCD